MTFKVHIQNNINNLLNQEDTDGDKKITIEDQGPKAFNLISEDGQSLVIQGTYHLSNLLQELVIQKQLGKIFAEIKYENINELPANRISRMIKDFYWKGLTRSMDELGIEALIADTKNDELTASVLPVYVPFSDELAYTYYTSLEKFILHN